MKRPFFNLGAILITFIIGLAINNACAGDLDNATDSELRKLVSQLQQEVNSLKQRVAQLEGQINNQGSGSVASDGGFEVDGIHFGRDGFPDEKVDYMESSGYTIVNGVGTDSQPGRTQYEFDSKGRIYKYGSITLSYSGRTYTYTTESQNGTTKTHSELTYHLK